MNVVDTSVVTKWMFRERDSDMAVKLLEKEGSFFAPDYLKIEFTSNITKKIRAGILPIEEGRERRKDFNKINIQYKPYIELEALAFEFSTVYPVTFYDSLFVALAYQEKVRLYTFDERLGRSLKNTELGEIVIIPS